MKSDPMVSENKMKMATEIPAQILTPDTVETRIGTLRFCDGFPDDATIEKVYDYLDFQRGVQVYLTALPWAQAYALREGFRSVGVTNNQTVGISETLLDSKSLYLIPNCETIYCWMWLDLRDGPLVIESPPNILGLINDFWFNYVTDIGNAGPDRGKGGKYLLLPPGYAGEVPEGYYVFRSETYGNFCGWRGFTVEGDPKPAVKMIKNLVKVYLLAQAENPPPMKFINISGQEINTVAANDFSFYEHINVIIQEEPDNTLNSDTLGLLAAIGIVKSKPFMPDARMKALLTEAVAVGNAAARVNLFTSRIKERYFYPESAWFSLYFCGNHEFLLDGVPNLDARIGYWYFANGISPAMVLKMLGVGSQYAAAMVDSEGKPLDGSKPYKVHLPPNIPVKDFWSFVVYDNQTRTMLQTDQQFPSISSNTKDIVINPDTSVDIWFGPTPPEGHQTNWLQTVPGKGWFTFLRLYGPLQSWFDKTWRPGEIEPVK